MITVRRSKERYRDPVGKGQVGAGSVPLFGEEPLTEGVGPLVRVDEERLPPGASLAPLDAETLTLVVAGAIEFKDPEGRGTVVRSGTCLHMGPGSRKQPRLRNPSRTNWAHVFRASLGPAATEALPVCESQLFTVGERRGKLCAIASPDGRDGSLRITLDALVFWSVVPLGQHLIHPVSPGRRAWLHIVEGRVSLDGSVLNAGDGARSAGERAISFTALETATVLLFDVDDLAASESALDTDPTAAPLSLAGRPDPARGYGLVPNSGVAAARVSSAELFDLLWSTLVDVLGPAGTATILARAVRRAQARHPELGDLVITRVGPEYRYAVPASFVRAGGAPDALRHLLDEVRTLLTDLTGQVVLCRFDHLPEFRGWVA